MLTVFSSIVPFVLVGLIALIVGILVGLLISGLFSEDNHKNRKIPKDLSELIILFRDRKNSRIVIGIKSNFFRSIDDLPIKLVLSLKQLNTEFSDWLNIQKQDSIVKESDIMQQKISSDEVNKRSKKKEDLASFHSSASIRTDQSHSIPNQAQVDLVKVEQNIETSKSIAAQIDQIIQGKIVDTKFSERSIRLMENPSCGVEVFIDGKKYSSVDEVDEEPIRYFIKECVSEWEKKAGAL